MQFAIISVALDAMRDREIEYMSRHDVLPRDHLDAVNELRELLRFSGPIELGRRPQNIHEARTIHAATVPRRQDKR